jgi:hypothetical protein
MGRESERHRDPTASNENGNTVFELLIARELS